MTIFGLRGALDAEWERCQSLKASLAANGVEARLVNKLSGILEDLFLVARYQVVSTPTVVISRGKRVLYRYSRGLPPAFELLQAWARQS